MGTNPHLVGSIKHWRAIADGLDISKGASNCDLCETYLKRNCRGCSVFNSTGEPFCKGTPYHKYNDFLDTLGLEAGYFESNASVLTRLQALPKKDRKALKKLAEKELAFLTRLL